MNAVCCLLIVQMDGTIQDWFEPIPVYSDGVRVDSLMVSEARHTSGLSGCHIITSRICHSNTKILWKLLNSPEFFPRVDVRKILGVGVVIPGSVKSLAGLCMYLCRKPSSSEYLIELSSDYIRLHV